MFKVQFNPTFSKDFKPVAGTLGILLLTIIINIDHAFIIPTL